MPHSSRFSFKVALYVVALLALGACDREYTSERQLEVKLQKGFSTISATSPHLREFRCAPPLNGMVPCSGTFHLNGTSLTVGKSLPFVGFPSAIKLRLHEKSAYLQNDELIEFAEELPPGTDPEIAAHQVLELLKAFNATLPLELRNAS